MSHEWDTGFMAKLPSWHRMENAVLKERPRSWEVARPAAGLMWDVETEEVYRREEMEEEVILYEAVEGYQRLYRDDNRETLAVRPSSYEVITNKNFGKVIDAVLGLEEDEFVEFEALMSLYGGKQIVALCYFPEPLKMPWDPSKTFLYLCFVSRHDGNGGLRGIPTNVRVQCANTLNQAESLDGRTVGFTIRHTASWTERVKEVRQDMIIARGESAKWLDFAEQLAMWKVGARQREAYLKKYLPISDENGKRKNENQLLNREKIRGVLASKTCEGIADTGYGLLMASTEWSDHFRDTQSADSFVSRQLLRKEEPKARSARILRQMAGVKL